jgi:hypothetical protein
MNLPVNLKILLTGLLKPVNYGKKSVVDNIGPRSQCGQVESTMACSLGGPQFESRRRHTIFLETIEASVWDEIRSRPRKAVNTRSFVDVTSLYKLII